MKKNKVILDRETYTKLITFESVFRSIMDRVQRYMDLYDNEVQEKTKLLLENRDLKAALDKDGDTKVIKHDDKLYRVASIQHLVSDDGTDEVSVDAVLMRGVG